MTAPKNIDIQKVATIAKQAGAEILALRDAVIGKAVYKKAVTEADKRASDIVCQGLAELTPDIPVISEENPDAQNRAILAGSETCWIVDPLDGTRSFIDGYGGFGVHIALMHQGQPLMAAIYFPVEDWLYFTDGTNGAYLQKGDAPAEKLHVSTSVADGEKLRAAVSWVTGRRPCLEENSNCTMSPFVGGARLCAAAENKVDIAILDGPFSYWDIAAAHALLKAAGGELYELDTGLPTTYPKDTLSIPRAIGGHKDIVASCRDEFLQGIVKMDRRPQQPNPPAV